MNHGMYTALSGSLANERRLEILTNNLANLNTSGFKQEMPVFSSVLAQQKKILWRLGHPRVRLNMLMLL